MTRVRLRVFGPLKDIVRCEEMTLEIPPPGNGEAAFETLASSFPALRPWRASVRLAVNLCYVPFDAPLQGGDEISFIPPVSGG